MLRSATEPELAGAAEQTGRSVVTILEEPRMAHILAVTFDQPTPFDSPELREPLQQSVPDRQELPGLLWKIWTSNPDTGRGASFYLFDTEQHAKSWGEGPLIDALNSLPGYTNINVEYFQVDEDFSLQTFATLGRSQVGVV